MLMAILIALSVQPLVCWPPDKKVLSLISHTYQCSFIIMSKIKNKNHIILFTKKLLHLFLLICIYLVFLTEIFFILFYIKKLLSIVILQRDTSKIFQYKSYFFFKFDVLMRFKTVFIYKQPFFRNDIQPSVINFYELFLEILSYINSKCLLILQKLN